MVGSNGTNNGHAEQITGRVLRVNEKGLRLEGRDGWVNFSKFAQDLVPPSMGAVVALTLDGQGFIRRVGPVEPCTSAAQDCKDPKDRTITRLAVLKAAAEFAASRPPLLSGDVLKVAASWERWVLREGDA